MSQKPKTKPVNFWLIGDKPLIKSPEIAKGLKSLLKKDPALKSSHNKNGMDAWKIQPDGFEGMVNIILAQQISTAVASHLVARIKKTFPTITPRRLLNKSDDDLRAIGMSRQKINYCRILAESIVAKKFNPNDINNMDNDEAMAYITSLKGLGPWSAEIYLMLSLGRGDIWPAGDMGIQKGVQKICGLNNRPSPKETREISERWAPHRTAAALIIWRA